MTSEPEAADIDFTRIVRPGDHVVVQTGTGEPQSLTRALLEQRHRIGPFTLVVNALQADVIRADRLDGVRVLGTGAVGKGRTLTRAGVMDVLPVHYFELMKLIQTGRLPVDVYLMQLAPAASGGGGVSYGTIYDWQPEVFAKARTVVAEMNAGMPWTNCGGDTPPPGRLDHVADASYRLPQVAPATFGEVERRIAGYVSELVPDGAVIQIGVGAIPDAVLDGLKTRRRLGIHSALLTDAIVELVEAGAVTGETKPIDTGKMVAGLLFGTDRLYRFVDGNPDLLMRPIRYTHAPATMARFDTFVTINTGVEVDLTGQVNAEMAGGDYVGGVTGLVDYVRGARVAANGRSIIALTSTARTRSGTISRIQARLPAGVVTIARSDIDTVVTEHRVAELLGQPLQERMRRMIAVAHPDFREALEREAHGLLRQT
ncbi:MAG: acetyl-CoA hydrolase/transferase family protein [Hyphomicrobiaceae bacterium]